ncbi:hypothetical protein EVG20_g1882 [Dentipellis fragilis]|uniref:Fungal-type protein kinase domain-containing protein n=1 Tax=Dentipellis fragilis TaxID=205917 RepID=A0A4Y9ZBC5_9AGAM|nr:hypothetical protein EVG20_g1882 [Dentipellis fragilis]
MRPLVLHASALNDDEYELFTSSITDLVAPDPPPADDEHFEKVTISIREARAWLRGRYPDLPVADLDEILRYFTPGPGQDSALTGGQFFAILRLVLHARNGAELERNLVFVQGEQPSNVFSFEAPSSDVSDERGSSDTTRAECVTVVHLDKPAKSGVSRVAKPQDLPISRSAPPTHPITRSRQDSTAITTDAPSSDTNPFHHLNEDNQPPVHPDRRASMTSFQVVESSITSTHHPSNPFVARSKTIHATHERKIPPLPPRKPQIIGATTALGPGGVIVGERFNFVNNPDMLKEFLLRFNRLNAEARGWDTSVTLASAEEAAIDREMFPPGTLVHKVHAKDDADQTDHYFLVSKPADYGLVACGRATKCYIALDMETKERVWLKDLWRIDLPDMLREYKIYEKLRLHGVSNIPQYHCGGDIAQQRTASVDFEYKAWLCGRHALTPHRHYRLVLQVIVGRRLREYRYTKELCGAIRDAMVALGEAHGRAGVLHQDVSGENIMITTEGKGVLIYWDLAGDISYKAPTDSDEFQRTSTRRFMSVNLLSLEFDRTAHGLLDDMESAFWVLLYHTTRFQPAVTAKIREPKTALHSIFDRCDTDPDGRTHGGWRKLSYLTSGFVNKTLLKSALPVPMFDLLQEIRRLYYLVYADFSGGGLEYLEARQKCALESLKSVDAIVDMISQALDKEGWPNDDKGIDAVYPVKSDTESDDEESGALATNVVKILSRVEDHPSHRQ